MSPLSVILIYVGVFLAAVVLVPPIMWLVYESNVWDYPPFSWVAWWYDYWGPRY